MHAHGFEHFTGKKAGKRIRRKSRSPKKDGSHESKYAHLAPKKEPVDTRRDKSLRFLPVFGKPGTVVQQGLVVLFHGRRYVLSRNITIPHDGAPLGRFVLAGLR